MNESNVNNLEDKTLICCDCEQPFLFTAGERAYFKSKSLSEPKRCRDCRQARKNSIVPDQAARHG